MKKFILAFAILANLGGLTSATIIIEPPVEWKLPEDLLYLKNYSIRVNISEQIATTTVELLYQNDSQRDLEGTFIFPISEEAAVSKLFLKIGNEEVPGRILDQAEARQIYEEIVRRKKDPALLEYTGYGLLKARVYPIGARGETRIKLSFSQVLRKTGGLLEYRFPFGKEMLKQFERSNISMEITLKSKGSLKNIYSPTHDIKISERDELRAKVTWEARVKKTGGDFVLYYSTSEQKLGFDLLTDTDQKEKFFLALVSPELKKDATLVLPKNVIFILDSSGSMRGEKINQAKAALSFCLQNLNPKDHFNLIDFDDQVRVWKNSLVAYSKTNAEEAQNFLKEIEAEGGTNIYEALCTGISQFSSGLNYLIFLTDGLPTVGTHDVNKILTEIQTLNKKKVKIFDFGVGYDVNTYFLDKLALQNQGSSDYVAPEEDIESKVSAFYKKITSPVLANLTIDFDHAEAFEIYPNPLPDLFAGNQIVIAGKFRNLGPAQVRLSGDLNGTQKSFFFPVNFTEHFSWQKIIPKIWANRRIGYLLDQIRLAGESKEVAEEIVDLSKKNGIMTKYTSFLADADVQTPRAELYDRASSAVSYAPQTGEAAFKSAKEVANLRKVTTEAAPGMVTITPSGSVEDKKNAWVGGKNFFFQNGIWVESDCDSKKKKISIKAYSPAYFKLLELKPEFGSYFSLGEKLKFEAGAIIIEVGEEGLEELQHDLIDKLR